MHFSVWACYGVICIMGLITRKQMCARLGISNATLRRLMNALDITPQNIRLDQHNVATYLYAQDTLALISDCIIKAHQRRLLHLPGTHRCRGGCNRYLPKQQLNKSSICSDCALQRQLINIAYDKKPWQKCLNIGIVQKSINFLQNLLQKCKN